VPSSQAIHPSIHGFLASPSCPNPSSEVAEHPLRPPTLAPSQSIAAAVSLAHGASRAVLCHVNTGYHRFGPKERGEGPYILRNTALRDCAAGQGEDGEDELETHDEVLVVDRFG
jgi:hypothetical protein